MMGEDSNADFFFERILTKISKIDVPGYISSDFITFEGRKAFERIVFMPEDFFIRLENLIIAKYGEGGKRELYCIGKRFGYRFASIFQFSRREIANSVSMIFRFLETLYAEKINITDLDVQGKTLTLYTKNLAVTSKNGMGYVLTVGGCAGIWGYLTEDYSLDCSVRKISAEEYELKSAPKNELVSDNLKGCEYRDYSLDIDEEDYMSYNSKHGEGHGDEFSMTKLMELGFVSYNKGKMNLLGPENRLVSVEIFLLFEMEKRLDKDVIFNASYDCFYQLGRATKKQIDSYLFISQILTALGFGIVSTIKDGSKTLFNFSGYPWLSKNCENTNFSIVKGVIKGFIDGNTGIQHNFDTVAAKSVDKNFILTIEGVD